MEVNDVLAIEHLATQGKVTYSAALYNDSLHTPFYDHNDDVRGILHHEEFDNLLELLSGTTFVGRLSSRVLPNLSGNRFHRPLNREEWGEILSTYPYHDTLPRSRHE